MIYLDNSATTRPFDEVTAAVAQALTSHFFNPSSLYRPAMEVELLLRKARQAVRRSANAQEYRVVFTSGGTEGANLALTGGFGGFRGRRTGIIISAAEHPAVTETARALEKRGAAVKIIPVNSRGLIDLSALEALVDENTACVSVVHVSSETGAVQPIRAVAELAHKYGALCHSDGVQAYLRQPPGPFEAGIDLYSVSAHKVHGPKGTGAVFIKPGVHLTPHMMGGGQEEGYRSGTENVPGILGLAAGVERYLLIDRAAESLRAMKTALAEQLISLIPETTVNGPPPESPDSAPHILNVSFAGVRGEVLLHSLEAEGVYVSTGSACSSRKRAPSAALAAMGKTPTEIESAVRFSLSPMNTMEEMTAAADICRACVASLRKFTRR